MPELPELQAHAERLTDADAGAVLAAFTPLSITALKTAVPPPSAAVGRPLDRVTRRGKHLLLAFDDLTFLVHLMQGGRLRPDPGRSRRPRGGLARWTFADGRALLLTEAGTEHRAGVWVLAGDPSGQPPLDGLGPEADAVGPDELLGLLRAHPMRLHGWLRDQRILAGLGRRLANEVCWRARLSPFAPTARLGPDDAERLVAAIASAVEEGLTYERSLSEMSASADRPGGVHHRGGESCPLGHDTIRSVEYRSYTVAYCPTCQTAGRVLADNTTSKFLR
ncbi:MAG: Fpg/Nei family DNA glycosylase [Acidimicrobiales bacterium]|nr:Fpg/Nei family DNA glycosylase [Acidimicrobiales bacterium]